MAIAGKNGKVCLGDNKVIDAFRTAEAYRKRSLAYVETVLNNEKKF